MWTLGPPEYGDTEPGVDVFMARDTVTVDAFELVIGDTRVDAQLSADGTPFLRGDSMDIQANWSTGGGTWDRADAVDGAITDGASVCYARLYPMPPRPVPGMTIGIVKHGNAGVSAPRVVGTFAPPAVLDEFGNWELPPLPTPWEDVAGAPGPSIGDFSTGRTLYVPPESYADPTYISGEALNNLEQCPMEFRMSIGGNEIGSGSFILRRPPLVLVHGIMSGPETWGPETPNGPWFEDNVGPTRVYRVDWGRVIDDDDNVDDGTGGHKGFAENYGFVAKMIERALIEYREGRDHPAVDMPLHEPDRGFFGKRYAAARADVVGHSQGGLLTRWYIAQVSSTEPISRGPNWPRMRVDRHQVPQGMEQWIIADDGHWWYLRPDNFGAGSIRRFISIGSPFRGSPLAGFSKGIFEPVGARMNLLKDWAEAQTGGMPGWLSGYVWPNGSGFIQKFSSPTCIVDLDSQSWALHALHGTLNSIDNPSYPGAPALVDYPTGHRAVRWFALVGRVGDINNLGGFNLAPGIYFTAALIDQGLGTFPSVLNAADFLGRISQNMPGSGDLIVEVKSQRDSGAVNDSSQVYQLHMHSDLSLPLITETTSPYIRDDVRILLGCFPVSITLPTRFHDNFQITEQGLPRYFRPLEPIQNWGN